MKMKKSMKRIFSWMLVVCLLVSVIPAGEADAAAKFKRGTSVARSQISAKAMLRNSVSYLPIPKHLTEYECVDIIKEK